MRVATALASLVLLACGTSEGSGGGTDAAPSDGAATSDASIDVVDAVDAGDASSPLDASIDAPRWACLPPYANVASRDLATWPFASDSPFNTPLGSGAAFESASDPCTKDIGGSTSPSDIAAHEWSQPVYVATGNDPTTTLTQNGQPFATGVHVPASATPALPPPPNTDGNLNVVDPAHRFLDESWRATRVSGGWDAAYWFKQDLRGPGCTLGGVRAYGGSTLAGLIRVGELKTAIRHALGFAIDGSLQKNAWVWPATTNDGHPPSSYQGHLPMGQLVAIPPSVDLCALGLSLGGLVVARALQDFGAYLVDSSGGLSFYAEPPIEDDANLGERALLLGARADLPAIVRALRCVTNAGANAVGGPGARRAPGAPPAM